MEAEFVRSPVIGQEHTDPNCHKVLVSQIKPLRLKTTVLKLVCDVHAPGCEDDFDTLPRVKIFQETVNIISALLRCTSTNYIYHCDPCW